MSTSAHPAPLDDQPPAQAPSSEQSHGLAQTEDGEGPQAMAITIGETPANQDTPDREILGALIAERLRSSAAHLTAEFRQSGRIPAFVLDDLVPASIARRIYAAFPETRFMRTLNTFREHKCIAAQMDDHDPILEEAVYAFQQPEVIEAIAAITGLEGLEPDEHLYAGGISRMEKGHFLNPHLDNSHDKDRQRYRVLNLLWYVTPDYPDGQGGNLELWDAGPKGTPREIPSFFNRLAVMATDRTSWHSVSPITGDVPRCCVSNYYFSQVPLGESPYFHVTSYRGRPEQTFRDLLLSTDARIRMALRRLFPNGVRENPHVYKRPDLPDQPITGDQSGTGDQSATEDRAETGDRHGAATGDRFDDSTKP